jgi:hypothetical protein
VVGDIEGEVLTHHGESDESDVRVRFGHKEEGLIPCFWPETNPFLQVALKILLWVLRLNLKSKFRRSLLLFLIAGFGRKKWSDQIH